MTEITLPATSKRANELRDAFMNNSVVKLREGRHRVVDIETYAGDDRLETLFKLMEVDDD